MLLCSCNFQMRQHHGYLCYYINSYRMCTVFHILRNALLTTESLTTDTFFSLTLFLYSLAFRRAFHSSGVDETIIF